MKSILLRVFPFLSWFSGQKTNPDQKYDDNSRISVADLLKHYEKRAYENKSRGINCDDTIQEVGLDFNGRESSLTTRYDQQVSENEQNRSNAETELSQITENYTVFVQSEIDNISEEDHINIDHQESQITELENNIKEKDIKLKKLKVDYL